MVVSIPGAYTPICHQQHIPPLVKRVDELKAKGVDAVYVIAVNDPYVMSAWGVFNHAKDKVVFATDINAAFSKALGATIDLSFKDMGEVMPGFDKVAMLKYPHLDHINHIHHAGNSSGVVDGAAAVLIGSKEWGEAMGLKPRARIRATAKIGTDPTIMLTGPVPVTEKILKDSGMSIGDIDLFEVNEAFAAVVLRFMQAFQVSPDKVNVNGGAMALGHPLGATGAIIIGTLLDELERRDLSTGLATLCIASGMGAATIIERV